MKKIFAGFVAGCLALNFLSVTFAADYHGQDLTNKDFTNQNLDGSDFTGATLKDVKFSKTSAKKVIFKEADISGAWLNDSDFSGSDFREVTGAYVASRSKFDGANLEGMIMRVNDCTFKGADLKNTKFSGYIYNNDFSGANFSGANLRLMTVNTDSNKWKGAIYDDDTAWPDGFDPAKVGAVLSKGDAGNTAAAEPTTAAPSTAGASHPSFLPTQAPANPVPALAVNPFAATQAAPSIAGKYVGESNKQAWCTLNEDGSMVFHEGGQDMKGTYTVSGDDVLLTIAGQTIKTRISGNVLLPPGGAGQKLIKEEGGSGAAAAASGLEGKYVEDRRHYFELKANGVLQLHEGDDDMTGTYKADGDMVDLTIGEETHKMKIAGNTLVWKSEIFTKQ